MSAEPGTKPSRSPPRVGARPAAEPAGLPARQLAWGVVDEVLRGGRALDETFEREARKAGLEARDEALARAIAVVTFRRLGTIRQALLDRLPKGPPKDERALALLATAAAQIIFLDVPDHAAVDVTVRLARGGRLHYLAGLANAVLRRLARERDTILAAADALDTDTPDWLSARWRAAYGEEARAIAEAHRQGAAVDLSVRQDPAGWAGRLNATLLSTGAVRLTERGPIRELPGYAEGAWWVQDAAAALPARLLAVHPGERVADLCAAPGGKTAQLAAAGAQVLAVDRSAPRLKRLSENMARLDLAVETRAADALTLEAEPFDAVLLDAPCSATGTIRRHPDVLWVKSEEDIAKLAALQARLLDKAADLTKPGGRLVYCTCSLEPEEGEHQAAAFLARHSAFRRDPARPEELPGLSQAIGPEGDVRTLPHHGGPDLGAVGLDGFFIARFRRDNS
ncbi:MAG TPA: transcription antitermination factor NusB [Beijerinckiaceae bacterium]